MPAAALPPEEDARLRNLKQYLVLDSPPEKAFDSITQYAAKYFDVPVALITLIDQNRQWFKACFGVDINETPRDVAFCSYAILSDDILVIPDATLDPRFSDNPLVIGEPNVRFYAGAPLRTAEGYNIGTLCLIDMKPREFGFDQKSKLQHLAKVVTTRLQLRLATLKLAEANAKYLNDKEN